MYYEVIKSSDKQLKDGVVHSFGKRSKSVTEVQRWIGLQIVSDIRGHSTLYSSYMM